MEQFELTSHINNLDTTSWKRELTESTPPRMAPILAPFPPLISTLIALVGQIRQELESNILKLLSLNPGRREAIAQYLDRLANLPAGPSTGSGSADAAGGLRRWVDTVHTPAQEGALRTYFEEVALITVGQALLLKAWSDRGIRPIKQDDLSRLNWALSGALKPYLPMDRESWQITKPNLYSWYNPTQIIQRDLWKALECVQITETDSSFPCQLLRLIRQFAPEWPEWKSYDVRFFQSIWENASLFGFHPETQQGPIKRKAVLFSPTLRDGSLVQTGPQGVHWIGLEKNPFHLFLAELSHLWWGPAAPPFWAVGSSLEVFSRDQLSLGLGSPKPTLLARISEMEACDLSLVLEERMIRGNLRSTEACDFREQADSLPHFKKLRSAGTSLGDLQACVALSKLRPGGLLWWAREEPLNSSDGKEMLSYLLDRSRLLCEWNFSEVDHSLPAMKATLFPKYLYLFVRENDVQKRLNHRPHRINVQGHIRSHVEVPHFLGDALQTFQHALQPRGQWKIHLHPSPSPQKDWAERWPDPSLPETYVTLEELRSQSLPLASFATVRSIAHEVQPELNQSRLVAPGAGALWISQEMILEKRHIRANRFTDHTVKNSGILILFPEFEWTSPLAAFLESETVQKWLEHHVERRGEKWVLTEQVIKFIPIPKRLLCAMGVPVGEKTGPQPPSSPLSHDLLSNPKKVKDSLPLLPMDEQGKQLRAQLFVQASHAKFNLLNEHSKLLSMIAPDGKIRWLKLLEILPRSECTAVTYSEHVQLSGNLPLHLPIDRIERVRSPQPGILFATESGPSLQISSHKPRILEILWDQLDGLHHPTWSELAQFLKVPRQIEVAETTAHDILKVHGEQSARLRDLSELLSSCPMS